MTPKQVQAAQWRAEDLAKAGRVAEAIAAYDALLAVAPDAPNDWFNLGWLKRRARDWDGALAAYGEALARGIDGAEEVHLNRAVILSEQLANIDKARKELEAALVLRPDYVPALLNLGNLREDVGDRDAARESYAAALAADPANATAAARLATLSDPATGEAELRKRIANPRTEAAGRAALGFALGALLDGEKRYDEAFAAYAAANLASRESTGLGFQGYDDIAAGKLIDRIIASFPESAEGTEEEGGTPPIFICGLFRSGSTLVEHMLGRHPGVTPGGELDLISSFAGGALRPFPEGAARAGDDVIDQLRGAYRAALHRSFPDARHVTDKRPDNFLYICLIKRLFPDAKIVHTVRAPLDNILSINFLHLDHSMAYALSLEDTARWYRQYRRLMAHWKALYPDDIHDVAYDALVRDPEAELRALLKFLGLRWSKAVLEPEATKAPVKTASAWQVRRPLYRSSSGRATHYAAYLEGVEQILGENA